MTRRVRALDRTAGLLLGLLLVAAGLLLLAWRTRRVLTLPRRVDLSPLRDTFATWWWPVVAAVVAVLLLLAALRWLVAHLPTIGSPAVRLRDSSADGRIDLDSGSVARAAAASLTSPMVLPDVTGRARERAGRPMLDLDARCSKHADVADVVHRADQVARDVATAFPSGDVALRLVVGSPRPPRRVPGKRVNARVE